MGPAGRIDVVLVCGGRWHDFDHARLQLLGSLAAHPEARTRVYQAYDCLGKVDLGSWVAPEFRTVLERLIAWGVRGTWETSPR
jgi:hypothetical protein